MIKHPEIYPEQIARFQREAALAARLTHPGIVQVHEAGVLDGVHFIAMEFIDGCGLTESLMGQPLKMRVDVVWRACVAVGFAHQHGVIHRDLKPANVMITDDGRVVVTDFGLARAEEDTRLTRSGEMLGTPFYMSPEQISGDRGRIDARSDVWALGVILYEQLGLERPFTGPDLLATYECILHRALAFPRDWPPGLAAICLKALCKQAEGRYPTAQELAEDLQRWRQGRAVLATRRSARGPLLALGLGIGLAGLLLIGLGLRFLGAPSPSAPPDEPAGAERTQSPSRPAQPAAERLVERLVAEMRAARYVAGVDYQVSRKELVPALQRLEKLDQHSVAQLTLLGVGWHRVGWEDRAESYLERALARSARAPRASYTLGRIFLERALVARYLAGTDKAKRREKLAEKAAQLLEASKEGWGGATDVDRHVASIFRALVRDERDKVARQCEYGMRRFGRQVGAEEYWQLRGYVRSGAERLADWAESLRRRPHDAWVHFLRASEHLRAERLSAAREDLDAALRINPRLSAAHSGRGIMFLREGKPELALKCFDRALQLYREDVVTLTNRAKIHRNRGDLQRALADFDRALLLAPDLIRAHFGKGLVQADRGQYQLAIMSHSRVIQLDGIHYRAYAARGIALRHTGDLQGSLNDLKQAVGLAPRQAKLLSDLASTRRLLGQLQKALTDVELAIVCDPSYPPAYVTRGLLRGELDNPRGALADFDKALELDGGMVQARVNRGRHKRMNGDARGALSDLNQALDLDNRCADAFHERSWLRRAAGNLDGAIEDMTRATQLAPSAQMHWYNLGVLCQFAGQIDSALKALTQALKLDPTHGPGWFCMGNIRLDQKNYKQAIIDYTRAITNAPSLGRAYVMRATARGAVGDRQGQAADLDRATQVSPGLWQAWYNRGSRFYQKAEYERALADFREAVRLAPREYAPWYYYGLALGQLGRKAPALKALRRSLQLAPAGQKADLLNEIGKLQK